MARLIKKNLEVQRERICKLDAEMEGTLLTCQNEEEQ